MVRATAIAIETADAAGGASLALSGADPAAGQAIHRAGQAIHRAGQAIDHWDDRGRQTMIVRRKCPVRRRQSGRMKRRVKGHSAANVAHRLS